MASEHESSEHKGVAEKVQLPETVGPLQLPVLPLRDVVIYPSMVIPLFVGRERSIRALEAAMLDDKRIFLVAQKESGDDEPDAKNLFSMGTVSSLLQLLKLPDGTVKVLVEGESRAKSTDYIQSLAELDTEDTPTFEKNG
ncbi:MAG: LON peptidase substrate-binding domain-containing protein, partial [Gammaproteobacteria bacterium]|nr:LON peptidase substrate-binding domain-containing protein [Gammaproteobacteria bacterium]